MVFKFFPTSSPEEETEETKEEDSLASFAPAVIVKITQDHLKLVETIKKTTKLPKFQLRYRPCNFVNKTEIKEAAILTALHQNSDVIPGVYEGGLSVWECTHDLLSYLNDNKDLIQIGMRVLELGCGAGLPGIFAFLKKAIVDFQDFNADVLRVSTIPNLLLNLQKPERTVNLPSKFIAGDWAAIADHLESQEMRYDLILTSETIYSLKSQPRLIQAMERLLHPKGKVLLAAKSQYFGVGGTVPQFVELLEKTSTLRARSVHTVDSTLKREILELTKSADHQSLP